MTIELKEQGITGVSAGDLLDLLENSWGAHPSGTRLALPPIQRDGVWRPRQVLEFWRSVLAGMPIGMFYVQYQPTGGLVVSTAPGPGGTTGLTMSKTPHYDLLDGQQRLRALSLGLRGDPMNEKRTLWLVWDDKKWHLRLTSRMQPFGYDGNGDKLGVAERRRAREALEPDRSGDPIRFAGTLPPGRTEGTPVFDSDLYEYEAKTETGEPIPRPPLPAGYQGRAVKLADVVAALRGKGDRPAEVPDAIWNDLEKRGEHLGDTAADIADIAAIMAVPPDVLEGDGLPAFFRRVGAGGTPITEEEQLFAAFKAARPFVRDTVHDIQTKVSAVFTPAQVMATVRRIANMGKESALGWLPGFDTTLAALKEPDATSKKSELAEQFDLLLPEQAVEPPMPKAFERARDLLQGEGADLSDLILAKLPSELWQVLVYWCHRNAEVPVEPEHRREAARFAMYWLLKVGYPERCVRYCFPIIRDQAGSAFPGLAMYEKLTTNGGQPRMFPPGALEPFFCAVSDAKGRWSTHPERFQESAFAKAHPNEAEAAAQWWYSHIALLWLQRDYLKASFPGYLPLTDHEEDRPYDLDHVAPQAGYKGAEPDKHRAWATGNTIGNFRLVEASVNRGDGDDDVAKKLPFLADPSNTTAGTAADFRIGENEAWLELAPKNGSKTWDQGQKDTFQQVVQARAAALYQLFYEGLGFNAWFGKGS